MARYRAYNNVYKEKPHDHLSRSEALQQYQLLKRKFPNALVELEQLDCGHWQVVAHTTKEEKDQFVKNKWNEMVGQFTTA